MTRATAEDHNALAVQILMMIIKHSDDPRQRMVLLESICAGVIMYSMNADKAAASATADLLYDAVIERMDGMNDSRRNGKRA